MEKNKRCSKCGKDLILSCFRVIKYFRRNRERTTVSGSCNNCAAEDQRRRKKNSRLHLDNGFLWECRWCKKNFDFGSKYTKSGHLARCEAFIFWKNMAITKEFLETEYQNKERSLPEIANMLGLENHTCIVNQMKKFGISLRPTAVTNVYEGKAKEKARKTSLAKTGTEHNFCRENQSRKNWEEKMLAEEGIKNVFQRESVKEKITKTMVEKYGVESPGQLPRNGRSSFSKIHRKVVSFLQFLGLDPKVEKKIKLDKTAYRSFDIFVAPNYIIEVNGDFWHANPLKYDANRILKIASSKLKKAKEIWAYDEEKILLANRNRFSVLSVWQIDIETN